MILERIISGGQTGADQAALRAARAAGIPTGGWAPRGWSTETGPAPWLADFWLFECEVPGYQERTRKNVEMADAVLWFGNPYSLGGRLTFRCCETAVIDTFTVISQSTPVEVADWLHGWVVPGLDRGVRLMVAGNRESKAPGIGARTEAFLVELFRLLKE